MVTLPFEQSVSTGIHGELERIIRERMRGALADILEEELNMFMEGMGENMDHVGRQMVVRNGYHRERTIQTGVGPLSVKVPRTRNREGGENFQSAIIPAYKRSSVTLDEAICYFYLKGVSTNDMESVLRKLFGPGVDNLSPASVSRLKNHWFDEFNQ